MNHTKSTETLVMEYLDGRRGEPVLIRVIAGNVGLSEASVKITLTDMASRGRIRGSSSSGKVAYYLPTEEQMESEQLARQRMPAWTPEHRVSQTKRELYARISAERAAIPSIG